MIRTWSTRGFALLFLLSISYLASCKPTDEATRDTPADSASSELATRLASVLARPYDATTRGPALARILDTAAQSDLPELRHAFEAASAYLYPSDLEQFATWTSALDPADAMRHPIAASTAQPDFWQIQVLRAWAAQRPQEAQRAWQAGECGTNELCMLALVAGWLDADREGAWSFVEQFSPGVLRQRAMDLLVTRLIADQGLEASIDFVESIEEDAPHRFKLQLFRRLATALALRDLERAGRFAAEHGPGPFGDGLARRVAVRMVARSGAQGMHWASALAPEAGRDDAVQAGARRWIQTDREAALAWFAQVEPQPALAPALVVYAQALVRDEPERAFAVVEALPPGDERDRATVSLLRIWLAHAADEANAWIEDHAVAADLVARARANPPRRGARKKFDR